VNSEKDREENAYNTFVKAAERLYEASEFELDMDVKMNIVVEDQEENIESVTNMNLKQITKNESDVDFELSMLTEMNGQSIDMKYYYTGGYLYTDYFGEKYRIPMDVSEALDQANSVGNLNFSKEDILKAEVVKNNGTKQIKMLIDKNLENEMTKRQLSSLYQNLGENTDLQLSDIIFTANLDKNDDIKSYYFKFEYEVILNEKLVNITSDLNFNVVSIENVVVEFPNDLDKYED
jgi:hypothetical protein